MNVAYTAPRGFADAELRVLKLLSDQAAMAIQNAQLYEAERRRVAALTALHETGLDVSQQLDLPPLLQTIVSRAAQLLGSDSGGLYMVTPDGTAIECVISLNKLRSFTGVRLPLGQGVAGRVAASGPSTQDDQPGAVVRVYNTGAAIPAADFPHLFERFFRGQTGLDSGEAGTGLGLSICKEIVEQHGGSLAVQSSEAEGTTFTVWLPMV